jgi:hypothetical protein
VSPLTKFGKHSDMAENSDHGLSDGGEIARSPASRHGQCV